MSEIKMLYSENEAIKELNKVDGFEASELIRIVEDEEGQKQLYLDVKYRKLWFRLKYPNGKIQKIRVSINKDIAIFEARIYADKNDGADNYPANAFASKVFNPEDTKFGAKFVEAAETAAVGRALADAGFGVQFCDVSDADDPAVVDAGIPITDETDEQSDEKSEDTGEETEKKQQETTDKEPVETPAKPPVKKKPAEPKLTSEMPVEELVAKMSVEYACSLKITSGFYAGKTLRDIAVTKPAGLKYYAEKWNDNLIKAGAIVLIREAEKAS